MFKRVKQVIAAVTAKIMPEDRTFVSDYLTIAEEALFWGMNLPDQRHALNVAYTALQLAKQQENVDSGLLVKCALLHDVGKIKGDVSTADKVITVIGHKLSPRWGKRWGRLGRGNRLANLRHAFYIYFHHACRSGAMLTAIDAASQVIDIIIKHHQAPTDDDVLELILLREADELH